MWRSEARPASTSAKCGTPANSRSSSRRSSCRSWKRRESGLRATQYLDVQSYLFREASSDSGARRSEARCGNDPKKRPVSGLRGQPSKRRPRTVHRTNCVGDAAMTQPQGSEHTDAADKAPFDGAVRSRSGAAYVDGCAARWRRRGDCREHGLLRRAGSASTTSPMARRSPRRRAADASRTSTDGSTPESESRRAWRSMRRSPGCCCS